MHQDTTAKRQQVQPASRDRLRRDGAHTSIRTEVAWEVEPPWHAQGIAAEAARALVAWLARQSVQTVIAHIDPRQEASAAMAAAAGLVPTEESQNGETRWRLKIAP